MTRLARIAALALLALVAAAPLGARPVEATPKAGHARGSAGTRKPAPPPAGLIGPVEPPPRHPAAGSKAPRPGESARLSTLARSHANAVPLEAELSPIARLTPAELPENAPIETVDGETWIGAHDLARLLGATKFWRPDLRKLELRSPHGRILLTADNPFVLVDDRTVQLAVPIRSRGGQLRVPVALVDSLPRDSGSVRLAFDPRRRLVLRVPDLGLVESPRLAASGSAEQVVFPADQPAEVSVIGRDRSHFRIRFGGLFVGALPESLPPGGTVRGIATIAAVTGTAFEFDLAPEAQGFRIERGEHPGSVTLTFSRAAGSDFERFAPEGPPGPRPVHIVVLDPGHGGEDAGVSVAGAVEKDLTLALARQVARELEHRLRARVVFTRADDRPVTVQERAERANRAHADLVLSLHFDAAPGPAARGATAYCPPATFGGALEPGGRGPGPLELLPWRDVATRHAVRSRELAEAVLSSFELRGLGPARLREVLPYPLLGVNAPGLMLECGTLTSESDRTRILAPEGLNDLAVAIVAGIAAYGRAE